MKDEVIVEIGAEGGSITLLGSLSGEGWYFRLETVDQSGEFLSDEDLQGPPFDGRTEIRHATATVDSWEAATALLDRHPWHHLYLSTCILSLPRGFWPRCETGSIATGLKYCPPTGWILEDGANFARAPAWPSHLR